MENKINQDFCGMTQAQLDQASAKLSKECSLLHEEIAKEVSKSIARYFKSGFEVQASEPESPFNYAMNVSIDMLKKLCDESSSLDGYEIKIIFKSNPENEMMDTIIFNYPDLPGKGYYLTLSTDQERRPARHMQAIIDYRTTLKTIMDKFNEKIGNELLEKISKKSEEMAALRKRFNAISEAEADEKLRDAKEAVRQKLVKAMKSYRDSYNPEEKPFGIFVPLEESPFFNVTEKDLESIEAPFEYNGKRYLPNTKQMWGLNYCVNKGSGWNPCHELPAEQVTTFGGKTIGTLTDSDIEDGIDMMLNSNDQLVWLLDSKL